jgi:hypothetical protein
LLLVLFFPFLFILLVSSFSFIIFFFLSFYFPSLFLFRLFTFIVVYSFIQSMRLILKYDRQAL